MKGSVAEAGGPDTPLRGYSTTKGRFAPTLDRTAAITRSLLGWGAVADPYSLAVGLALALTRPGFDPSRHALSLLMLGDWGWIQHAYAGWSRRVR